VTTASGSRPPRSAQNSSGSVSAVARRATPSAVTSSIARTWSAAHPYRRPEQAQAAAEEVADRADGGEGPGERREAVLGGRLGDLGPPWRLRRLCATPVSG
jgi:hypothetical protein